jgi:uncharacterized protein (DUF169 family)
LYRQLGLSKPPIAVAFRQSPPAGLRAWDGGALPAGCAFWQQAWEGQSFYTAPEDHYNCAIGCHTHAIALPAERADELPQAVGLMVESGYLRPEEVPGIPTLETSPRYVAYGPVDTAGFTPDVVVLAASPRQAMILYEAAVRAGAGNPLMNAVGRPGCAVLPLARQTGTAALSLGCIGNRLRTGVGDDELYLAIPGEKWEAVLEAARTLLAANARMAEYYQTTDAQRRDAPAAR